MTSPCRHGNDTACLRLLFSNLSGPCVRQTTLQVAVVTVMASFNETIDILNQPLHSWISTFVYITVWIILLCIIAFIGLKYWEILSANRRQTSNTTVLDPRYGRRFTLRTPFPSPSSPGSSTRRSPLSQVTSASSSTYSSLDQGPHAQPTRRFKMARWPLAPGWISIGAVEEGRIAKRRRALSEN